MLFIDFIFGIEACEKVNFLLSQKYSPRTFISTDFCDVWLCPRFTVHEYVP